MRSYYDENERGIIYLFDLFEYIDKKNANLRAL